MATVTHPLLPRELESSDAREAAIGIVTRGGLNKLLWDECRLIWDSRNLIDEDTNSENPVAIFGVSGKFETQENYLFRFSVRYIFDWTSEPKYGLSVHVNGLENIDDDDQVHIIQHEGLRNSQKALRVRNEVLSLTNEFEKEGMEAVIKSFLGSKYDTPGSDTKGCL